MSISLRDWNEGMVRTGRWNFDSNFNLIWEDGRMKFTVTQPPNTIDLADLPHGSFGVTTSGELFYRHNNNICVCLSCSGGTYTTGVGRNQRSVRVLGVGEKIEIVI